MKIIFFGTPSFALPALEALLKLDLRPSLIVTEPDKPRGRGLKRIDTPVKARAKREGIKLFQPTSFKKDPEAIAVIRREKPDLILVAAYGKILPKDLIEIPTFKTINVHPSILPKYRGPSPIQACLLKGDRLTGVSLMLIDEGMDTGPILAIEKIAVEKDDTFLKLSAKLADLSAEMIKKYLPLYLTGKLKAKEQPKTEKPATKLLKKEDGLIDFATDSRAKIWRMIKALNPWPGTYFFLKDGRRVLIASSDYDSQSGRLVNLRVKPEGKKEIGGAEFRNGYQRLMTDQILKTLFGGS